MTFRFLRNLAAISLAEVCAFAVPRKKFDGNFCGSNRRQGEQRH